MACGDKDTIVAAGLSIKECPRMTAEFSHNQLQAAAYQLSENLR